MSEFKGRRANLIGGIFEELDPNEIYRIKDGPRIFGVKATQLTKKIKAGEIPPPIKFFPTGRAGGWTGHMVNEHRRRIAVLASTSAQTQGAK